MPDILRRVTDLIDQDKPADALSELDTYMFEHPDDPKGHFLFGHIMMQSDKPAIAKMAFQSVVAKDPKRHQGWNNLGKAFDDLLMYKDAERCFRRALKIDGNVTAKENLSTNAIHQCNPDRAIHFAKQVLNEEESLPAHINLGFAYLMKGDFEKGWPEYEYGMGATKWRDVRKYADEPVWDGEKGKHIAVYGEQGIGDQIAMSGCIPDARRDCKSIVLDVNPKLKGLFCRSFILETHGDMFKRDIEWPYNRRNHIDASASLSQIQRFYRSEAHSFPKSAYLLADPVRRKQWKCILDDMPKRPKIGIAWTGGIKETHESARSLAIEDFLPILEQDADFINLEYKDRSEEVRAFENNHGIKIHDFPWATQTNDYDDTAALVKELDLVIAVPTSVVHLAGALDVPCYCLVHDKPHFMFGLEGSSMPFYKSVELFRRNQGTEVQINKIAEIISEM